MRIHPLALKARQHIVWRRDNASGCEPLHVGDRGSRISTVTDVVWLGDNHVLAAHHSGRRIGLFDLSAPQTPLLNVGLPFRVDALAAKTVNPDVVEIIVSATWDAHYGLLHLSRDLCSGEVRLGWRGKCMQPLRQPPSFSHGVFYVGSEVGVCYNAGEDPRIDLGCGQHVVRLPVGWFPTHACWCSKECALYIVANHHQAQPSAFAGARSSVWRTALDADKLELLFQLDNAHFDSCVIYNGRLWVNDQYGDRVLGIDMRNYADLLALSSPEIVFPHGIDFSLQGSLAVANYKTSSIAIFDLPEGL